jgi:antitoxin (DNA-binding transcriptional repressor) of toxin-antitoxin stability system
MKILATQELKERLDEILPLIEEGETVEVVDRGKVVVRLVPGDQPQQSTKQDLEAFWENIDRLTARISSYLPEKVDAVEIVREGRRDLGYSAAQTDLERLTSEKREHSEAWENLKRLATKLDAYWPEDFNAVDAVRDVRREL